MTTIVFNDRMCLLCGTRSRQEEIASTNEFGPLDLDLRPPEMMRSTISSWVQHCQYCDYTYRIVDEGSLSRAKFEKLKSSQSWFDANKIAAKLQLSANFTKFALVLEEEGAQPFEVARQYICGAWAADDMDLYDLAKMLRLKAVLQFEYQIASTKDEEIIDNSKFLMLDALRRCGEFDRCSSILLDLKRKNLEGIIAALLKYQQKLVFNKDSDCHTLGELED